MSLTPEQREARRHGLGGSDAAAVLGRHPSKGPASVWLAKVHGDREEAGERAEWGNRLEPVLREKAEEHWGQRITLPKETFVHPKHPWMLANVDGLFEDGAIFEAKCLDFIRSKRLYDLGEGEPLPEHWWQVQHYMEVLDRDLARMGCLVSGNQWLTFEVARDREAGALLVDRLGEFWHRYVLTGEPPPDESPGRMAKAIAARFPGERRDELIRTTSTEVYALAQKVARLRKQAAGVEAAKKAAENDLKMLVGDDLGFDFGGGEKVVFKATKGRPVVDTKAIAARSKELARIVAEHTRITPVRNLRVVLNGLDAEE